MKFQENIDIELKETYSKNILREIVAFANTSGGVIYVGINDEGSVVGVADADDMMLRISNIIRDGILPEVIPFIQIELTEMDSKQVIKITVAVGSERPYYVREKGLTPDGVFVRRGSACQPLSVAGIRDMMVSTSGKSYEEGRSLIQELSFNSFRSEMALRKLECGEAQMKTLHMIGSDGLYTNLAYLLSDQCPYSIKVAIFQGRDKTVFKSRKEFSGSLLKQLNDVYEYLDLYNKTKAEFKGLLREDKRDYPEEALREALLNSIIHRDYTFNGSTIVNIFDDHIEFASLGGLVTGLSMEAIFMGVSQSRNPELSAVFYRMRLVEGYGTGIDKIQRLYADCKMQPVFMSAEGAFLVKLYNKNEYPSAEIAGVEVEKIREARASSVKTQICDYVKKNGYITRRLTEELLGTGATAAYRALSELCDDGILEPKGAGRLRRYEFRK